MDTSSFIAASPDLHADCTLSRLGSRVAPAMIRCWQHDAERPIAIARGHILLSSSE